MSDKKNIGYLWRTFKEEIGLLAGVNTDVYIKWLENQMVDPEFKNPNIPNVKEYRYYTSEEVQKEYNDLEIVDKNKKLFEAIDYMQQHNGRSRFHCIAMAMGYENYEGEKNTYFKRGKQPDTDDISE